MVPLLDLPDDARAVLIAGPTASGKSRLALELTEAAARRGRDALIANADAMQVYGGLRLLTARPSAAEEARAAHRLYGHVSPAVRYSVGAWLTEARKSFEDALESGSLLIIVGGTGLYFKAATEGLVATPEIPDAVRRKWAERLSSEGALTLHGVLHGLDPASAADIRPGDTSRILRGLEVLEATGRPLRSWQAERADPAVPPGDGVVRLVLTQERDELYRRIDSRLDRMVAGGALEEVEALLARGLDPALPAMKAIGVREFGAVLQDRIPLAEALETAKRQTRRYAKRQMTWFRNQFPDWQLLPF